MAFSTNPKPEPRKRIKARQSRAEAAVKKAVRAQCVLRDGYCLITSRLPRSLWSLLGPCAGDSQWAHIGRHRRCFTRGLAPEERHTTAGSGMLCDKHHDAYDAHEFDFELDEGIGMDGMIGIKRRAA
ncbi:MAG: hypothetical protein RLY20_1096 [Verrucomicrobiota bacterium]|jgi:hypothetical protein